MSLIEGSQGGERAHSLRAGEGRAWTSFHRARSGTGFQGLQGGADEGAPR